MEENRYTRGKIYRIVCNVSGKQYIGSTTEPTLAKRLSYHRSDYKKWKNGKKNKITSFDILESNDFQIVLIEDYPCERKEQLLMRERYHIENTECVNKIIPTRTVSEYGKLYRELHKEKILENNKNRDKDKIKIQNKNYYENNKEKVNTMNKNWHENNKEKSNELARQRQAVYREKHRDIINERRRTKSQAIKSQDI